MFTDLKNKIKNFKKISPVILLRDLFLDKEFTSLIIRLNTQGESTSQLAYGINSKNEKLSAIGGEYSDVTLSIANQNDKPKKGKDVIDLHNTGYFYNSFKTYWTGKEIKIDADTIKQSWDGAIDLIDRWGKDIIGLDDENLSVLRDYAKTKLTAIYKTELKRVV